MRSNAFRRIPIGVLTNSQTYGVTSRHLLRLFETHVGYGPKALARIFRLQRTLSIAGSSPLALSDLALAAGYSDQSHMYREFCAFCSERPSDVVRTRASTRAMCDLFKITEVTAK